VSKGHRGAVLKARPASRMLANGGEDWVVVDGPTTTTSTPMSASAKKRRRRRQKSLKNESAVCEAQGAAVASSDKPTIDAGVRDDIAVESRGADSDAGKGAQVLDGMVAIAGTTGTERPDTDVDEGPSLATPLREIDDCSPQASISVMSSDGKVMRLRSPGVLETPSASEPAARPFATPAASRSVAQPCFEDASLQGQATHLFIPPDIASVLQEEDAHCLADHDSAGNREPPSISPSHRMAEEKDTPPACTESQSISNGEQLSKDVPENGSSGGASTTPVDVPETPPDVDTLLPASLRPASAGDWMRLTEEEERSNEPVEESSVCAADLLAGEGATWGRESLARGVWQSKELPDARLPAPVATTTPGSQGQAKPAVSGATEGFRLAASMSKVLLEKGPRALQQDAAQVGAVRGAAPFAVVCDGHGAISLLGLEQGETPAELRDALHVGGGQAAQLAAARVAAFLADYAGDFSLHTADVFFQRAFLDAHNAIIAAIRAGAIPFDSAQLSDGATDSKVSVPAANGPAAIAPSHKKTAAPAAAPKQGFRAFFRAGNTPAGALKSPGAGAGARAEAGDSSIDAAYFRGRGTGGNLGRWGSVRGVHGDKVVVGKFLVPPEGRHGEDGVFYRRKGGQWEAPELGTTCTAALVLNAPDEERPYRKVCCIANAGDSDAAIFRFSEPEHAGQRVLLQYAQWLSKEHSMLAQDERERRVGGVPLAEFGGEGVHAHKLKVPILMPDGTRTAVAYEPTRGLGHVNGQYSGVIPAPSVSVTEVEDGDIIIVASDGLWNALGCRRPPSETSSPVRHAGFAVLIRDCFSAAGCDCTQCNRGCALVGRC
jgi:serine/threonine protein phosphatase PrpC